MKQQFSQDQLIEAHKVASLKYHIAMYRSRLSDISWFMHAINKPITRKANQKENRSF
ncbi:hypothetical protein [Shewanella baltica]|uniref:hypothetical protein n=1 Tax=Shewanella baltica TaxID=62322 RepID=UPI000ACB22E3|nr:hypothetical protein [Shewanella baltica]